VPSVRSFPGSIRFKARIKSEFEIRRVRRRPVLFPSLSHADAMQVHLGFRRSLDAAACLFRKACRPAEMDREIPAAELWTEIKSAADFSLDLCPARSSAAWCLKSSRNLFPTSRGSRIGRLLGFSPASSSRSPPERGGSPLRVTRRLFPR